MQSMFLLGGLTDGSRANDVGVLLSVAGVNSVTVGKYTNFSCEWKDRWGKGFCLLMWTELMNWVVWWMSSSSDVFYFFFLVPQWQLHLTTIPTSLSTSLLVSIAGHIPVRVTVRVQDSLPAIPRLCCCCLLLHATCCGVAFSSYLSSLSPS